MKATGSATPSLGKWARPPGELLCQVPDIEMNQTCFWPCENAGAGDGKRSCASRKPRGLGGGQLAHLGEQGEQPRGGEDGVESRK